MRFSWDPEKARLNLKRHGISFDEATTVFLDDLAKIASDPEHSQTEDRFIIVGMSSSHRVLLVVHCYRQNDQVIRIISARTLTKKERLFYEEEL